jgi:hypothetical protein
MRFMIIAKANKASELGTPPDREMLATMGKYSAELIKAGVLLDANGLKASKYGARVAFSGGKSTVIDGPFTEAKELIAGYSIFQCNSLAEAIEWVKRAPNAHVADDSEIEIRQIFEVTDFPDVPDEANAVGSLRANVKASQTERAASSKKPD